jgi:acetyl-CoA carboxylase biotin carboxyl carrier protein
VKRAAMMLLVRRGDATVELASPGVGVYADMPPPGAGLAPGMRAGTLTVLGRPIDLIVPEDGGGTVASTAIDDRAGAVAYGQTLLVLAAEPFDRASGSPPRSHRKGASRGALSRGGPAPASGAAVQPAPDGAPAAGEQAIAAPTHGVFYARPDPDSPPFVEAGDRLEAGQTAGLIEVMKCFSPIVHPGGSVPSPGVVVKVLVREGEEVRSGQPLFVLRPA